MEKNISAIIFDFGNVLIDLDISLFNRNIRELTGLHTEEEKKAFIEVIASYEKGLISTELFINRLIKLSDNRIQAREIIECWNSMLVGIKPESLDLLKILKPHYRTFILSNTNPLHINWVHRHLKTIHGIKDFEKNYLHGAFYSHDMNLAKPDPEIYKTVESRTNIPADEILFIDDLEENVKGALMAGWNATLHPAKENLQETLEKLTLIPNPS